MILSSNLLSLLIQCSIFSMVNIEIRCTASHFITQKRVYNTPDNGSLVLEKCYYVLDKSLKSPGISFRKKCGNLGLIYARLAGSSQLVFPVLTDN